MVGRPGWRRPRTGSQRALHPCDRLDRCGRQAGCADRHRRPGRCDPRRARCLVAATRGALRRLLVRRDGRVAIRRAARRLRRPRRIHQRLRPGASVQQRIACAAAARGRARITAVRYDCRPRTCTRTGHAHLQDTRRIFVTLRCRANDHARARALCGRGLPGSLRATVCRDVFADGFRALVRIARPACRRCRRYPRTRDRRRRGGGQAGAARRRLASRVSTGRHQRIARAALALRARCIPQGTRRHRRRASRCAVCARCPMSGAGPSPTTRAVRAGLDCDSAFGAVTPPIVLSSNFSFAGFNAKREYDYTRSGNPTRDLLGDALAALEGGAGGVVTSTGMSAITLVLTALLNPGDRIVVPHDAYGGSWRLFDALARNGRFDVVTADLTDPAALAAAVATRPALVGVETASNPLLRITDLQRVTKAARAVGARVVVDNTFLSPALQTPITLGADVVVHSTTKYINGHSDVVGGAVICADRSLHDTVCWWANALGLAGSPFDSFLTLRGLRTLDARLRVHQDNANELAAWLDVQPDIARVYFPGLASHPGHALAARQQRGFG